MSASPFMTAIRRHAAARPRAPVLTCGDNWLDWADFAAAAEQAAAAFQRHGISPGDRVAIVAAPSLQEGETEPGQRGFEVVHRASFPEMGVEIREW